MAFYAGIEFPDLPKKKAPNPWEQPAYQQGGVPLPPPAVPAPQATAARPPWEQPVYQQAAPSVTPVAAPWTQPVYQQATPSVTPVYQPPPLVSTLQPIAPPPITATGVSAPTIPTTTQPPPIPVARRAAFPAPWMVGSAVQPAVAGPLRAPAVMGPTARARQQAGGTYGALTPVAGLLSQGAKAVMDVALKTSQWPLSKTSPIPHMYYSYTHPEYATQEKNTVNQRIREINQQLATKPSMDIASQFTQPLWQEKWRLYQLRARQAYDVLDRTLNPALGQERLAWYEKQPQYMQAVADVNEAQRQFEEGQIGVWDLWRKTFPAQLRGWMATPEQEAYYAKNVGVVENMASSAAWDPLTYLAPWGGMAYDAWRGAKAARAVMPIADSVEDVARQMAAQGRRSTSLFAKINPFRLGPESRVAGAVNKSADVINMMHSNTAPDEFLSVFDQFVKDPDSLAPATAGYSSSRQAKEAVALIRRVVGDDETYIPKLVAKAQAAGTDEGLTVVADMTSHLRDAAESIYLPGGAERSALVKARDWTNNYLSLGYMGANPGYAFRNGANNGGTMLVDGVVPWHRHATLQHLVDRWGAMPIAGKAGMGAGMSYKTIEEGAAGVKELHTVTPLSTLVTKPELSRGTLSWAQQMEKLSSERIVLAAIEKHWPHVWDLSQPRIEAALRRAGLRKDHIEFVLRKVRNALNGDEVDAAISRAIAGGDDLAHTMPTSVGDALDHISESSATHIDATLDKAKDVGTADKVIQQISAVIDDHADLNTAINELKQAAADVKPVVVDQVATAVDTTPIQAWHAKVRAIAERYRVAADARMEAAWVQARGLPPDVQREVWNTTWEEHLTNYRRLFQELDAVDESMAEAVHLAPEAVERSKTYRQQWFDLFKQRREGLGKTWAASDAVKPGPERDAIWQNWHAEDAKFRAQFAQVENTYEAQHIGDLEDAYTRLIEEAKKVVPPAAPAAAAPAAEKAAPAAKEIVAGLPPEVDVTQLTPEERAALTGTLTKKAEFRRPPTPPPVPSAATVPPAPEKFAVAAAPAPPPVPAAITDQEIMRRAEAAGIATATKAGVPTERRLMAFARAHTPTKATRFADLTPAERDALAAALDQRAIGELPSAAQAKKVVTLEERLRRAETRNKELAATNQGLISDLAREAQAQTGTTVAVKDINLAPERFQYKLATGPGGITRQFKNVKAWNPDLGRGVSLWVDPADGKTYVVNGHHRVELARRFGADEIAAPYYIRAKTAADARMVGALQNIAEGRGTPVDAAKLFRDADMSLDLLTRNGLALTESNVAKGAALANLNDALFREVINKQLPIERAVIIGQKIPDPDMQMQLAQDIKQQIARGVRITNDVVAERADMMIGGPTATVTQNTLFGAETKTVSLAWEKADFYAYVRSRLGKEQRLFHTVSKNAAELARVGQIDQAAAAEISGQAKRLEELFDTLKNQAGPISNVGNEAAQALRATPGQAAKVKGEYYDRIVNAISDVLQQRLGPTAGGAANAGARGAAQAGPGLFDQTLGIVSNPLDPIEVGARAGSAIKRTLTEWWDSVKSLGAHPLEPLPPAQAQALRDVSENVIKPELLRAKAVTNDIATQLRNFALGDYAHKRNYLGWMTFVYPYITWYDFTYKNWAVRVLRNPAILSNYARYKAALAKINTARYREQTGDPNAEIPPWWEGQLRIPVGGHDFYFDLEATLNPLNNLLSEPFEPWARTRAPHGELMNKLNNWGPTMYAPIIWAYAAKLWKDGYKEAAAEWVSYLTPTSRAIKAVTALAREHIPGAEKYIPPGGISPEQIPNLWGGTAIPPTVQGGSVWERKRVTYFLRQLWLDGKMSAAEYQKESEARAGKFWDQATQMEATARALPQLSSFFLGAGFKARTPQDIDIQHMWEEYFKISDQYDTLPWEAYNRQMKQFDRKYPGFEEMRMARTFDPQARLENYSWMVIDRMPPGTGRYEEFDRVGIGDLYNKFKASKPDRSDQRSTWADDWSPEELAAWRKGIDALAQKYDVPSPEQAGVFDAAAMIHNARNRHAAEIVQQTGYPLTYEQLRELEDGYFAPGVDRKAYLAANPALAKYWDAKRTIDEQGVPWRSNEIYNIPLREPTAIGPMSTTNLAPASLTKPGPWSGPGGWLATAPEMQAVKAEYYTSAADKQLKKLFGDDILDLMSYYGSLSKDERKAYRQQHAAEYARLVKAWDYRDQQKAAKAAPAPPTTNVPTTTTNLPTATTSLPPSGSNAEYAQKRAEAVKLFGDDILYWADIYSALPKTGGYRGRNGSFAKEHPAEYARLKKYWDFIYGPSTKTSTSYAGGGGYTRRTYAPRTYTRRTYTPRTYAPASPTTTNLPPTGTGSWLPAATPVVTATGERLWTNWTPEQFTTLYDKLQTADMGFTTLINAIFDVYVLHNAREWFKMTPEQRTAWQAANPQAWEMLQKFLDWFQEYSAKGAVAASRMLQSMPPGAPIPPPLPPRNYEPLTTVPGSATI